MRARTLVELLDGWWRWTLSSIFFNRSPVAVKKRGEIADLNFKDEEIKKNLPIVARTDSRERSRKLIKKQPKNLLSFLSPLSEDPGEEQKHSIKTRPDSHRKSYKNSTKHRDFRLFIALPRDDFHIPSRKTLSSTPKTKAGWENEEKCRKKAAKIKHTHSGN